MAKGFNKGPAMGGQGGMMQQIQKLQKQMEEAQAKLAEETVSATAGGGAIKVTMTGDQRNLFYPNLPFLIYLWIESPISHCCCYQGSE